MSVFASLFGKRAERLSPSTRETDEEGRGPNHTPAIDSLDGAPFETEDARGGALIITFDLGPPRHPQRLLRVGRLHKRAVLSCLLLVCVFMSTLSLFLYVHRSTPSETLTTFCHDLQANDYHEAYQQFSTTHKPWPDEESFTRQFREFFANQQGVKTCTVESLYQIGPRVVGMMVLTLKNADVLSLDYQLEQEEGTWKFVGI